jgi:hypothetical protein
MSDPMILSALKVGPKDLMVMRSLLNLAGGRGSGPSWEISEQIGGDVILVDVDSDEGQETWEGLREIGERVIALTRNKDFDARFTLPKPLRSRDFLTLLNKVASGEFSADEEDIETDSGQTAVVESIWQTMEVSERQGQFTLAEHLRRQTWKRPVVITHPGWPLLVIDPGSGAWFFDGSISELTPPMFAETMPASAGQPISSADLVDRVYGHKQRSLSELKWFAGLAQSRGKLHPELMGDVEFMLTQVPGEATRNEQLHRLAQILIRGPQSIEGLLEQSGQQPENVSAFLNACYTSGKLLVNRTSRTAVSF